MKRPAGGEPVIPDYAGANVRGIIPALLGPGGWSRGVPDWMPAEVAEADAVVLLVLDGLGWEQFGQHRRLMPALSAMRGGTIQTVAPTTTATALSSITTGLTPGEHGLIGYRIVLGGDVVNVLRWANAERGVRRSSPPRDVQPFDPFMGERPPVISPAELENSGFTEAHLRGSIPAGWRSPSSIAVEAAARIADGEPFVYCYYGGIDKIAHERGFGPYYDAELQYADALVSDILATIPAGTALLVTADHGQVEVGDRIVHPSVELLRGVTLQSGEGRFRWLHVADGALEGTAAIARDEVGHLAWVVTREQTLDEGWFGPIVSPPVQSRLGDVALVAREPVSFYDAGDGGPFELVCRHGSLTSAEVDVPLLAALV
ncbi:MAG: alkaline phosphatase family protein [Acidimicrobiia bacterium]|nr:alkaline phosphatase family protein [Acidimicrobiia bacterium]